MLTNKEGLLNWKGMIVYGVVVVIVSIALSKWITSPYFWYSGDSNYEELVKKASHK